MPTQAPENPLELEELKTGMRKQLDARASLFDPLSPPPGRQPGSAESAAAEWKSTIRTGVVFSVSAAFMVTISALNNAEFKMVIFPSVFVLMGLIGTQAFRALGLLRTRVEALEKEMRELRQQSLAARSED